MEQANAPGAFDERPMKMQKLNQIRPNRAGLFLATDETRMGKWAGSRAAQSWGKLSNHPFT